MVNACLRPDMDRISTDLGVDSSSRFRFRTRTHTGIQSDNKLTDASAKLKAVPKTWQ